METQFFSVANPVDHAPCTSPKQVFQQRPQAQGGERSRKQQNTSASELPAARTKFTE